ncbi:MAG: DUF2029 domain-containing protein [Acidobacteria bacterium]|nr:DUF2029 domain-containing protein [Acidobacteriota bacterium]
MLLRLAGITVLIFIVVTPELTVLLGKPFYVVSLFISSILWLIVFAGGQAKPVRWMFVAAILARFAAFDAAPVLSDDVWRYLWDGKVVAEGLDPYARAPSSLELRELRESWHDRINHPDVRSIYPPYAQLSFLIAHLFGGGLLSWRLMLFASDLGILFLLARIDPRASYAWALCPIVVWEGVWNLHLDLLAALFVVIAWASMRRRSGMGAGAALGVAAGLKVTPLAMAPSLFLAAKNRARFLLGAAIVLVVAAAPFAVSGRFMPGMREFAINWSFNSPLYEMLTSFFRGVDATAGLKMLWGRVAPALISSAAVEAGYSWIHPGMMARATLAVVGVVIATLLLRWVPPARSAAAVFAILLLCSPTIHPWYWLPVLPIAILAGQRWVSALALFSGASYLLYAGVQPWIVMVLAYGAPMLIFAGARLRDESRGHERSPDDRLSSR